MLGLGVFLSGELKELRRRDQAAVAFVEVTAFGLEVENRPAATRGREAEVHCGQLNNVARRAHHRAHIVDLNVVGPRKISLALMGRYAKLSRLHHGAILRPTYVLLVIVAQLISLPPDARLPDAVAN